MIAFEVGYDVVWWDGSAHVVGDDIRGIADYLNSDQVGFEDMPRTDLRYACVLPGYKIGRITDEFEFTSALRIWANREGDWMIPLQPGDDLWPTEKCMFG